MEDKERLLDISEYTTDKVIDDKNGKGYFGTIKHATKDTEEYVIREYPDNKKIPESYPLREIGVLSDLLYHPAICKFFGFSIMPYQFVFEYIKNGSLQGILNDFKKKKKSAKMEWNDEI